MSESASTSFSLVKYNLPVIAEADGSFLSVRPLEASLSASSRPSSSSSQKTNDLEDILNTILPPREFEESGRFWKQNVCMDESSR